MNELYIPVLFLALFGGCCFGLGYIASSLRLRKRMRLERRDKVLMMRAAGGGGAL